MRRIAGWWLRREQEADADLARDVVSAVAAAASRSRPSASSVSAAPALRDGGAVAVLGDRHAACGDDQATAVETLSV